MKNKSSKKQVESNSKNSKQNKKEKIYEIGSFNIDNADLSFRSLDIGKVVKIVINSMYFNELGGASDQISQQIVVQLTMSVMNVAAVNVAQSEIGKNIGGKTGELIGNTLNNLLNLQNSTEADSLMQVKESKQTFGKIYKY